MNSTPAISEAPRDLTARPTVLTIHGVCPGPWQEAAQCVFEPHFRYMPIRYSGYECSRGGAIKAVIHPFALLAAVGLFAWAVSAGSSAWWYVAPRTVVVGALIAGSQRRKCGELVKRQISSATTNSFSTQVIAHSFGTDLTTRASESYDILFDRVIFVGCVLPRRFGWSNVTSASSPATGTPLPDIRNETGTSDLVSLLAGATGWMSRELGRAGQRGFKDVTGYSVHTTTGPWHDCDKCQPTPTSSIHNVPLAEYGHSSWALGLARVTLLAAPSVGLHAVYVSRMANRLRKGGSSATNGERRGFQ